MKIIDVPNNLAARIVAQIEDFESIAGELRRINKKLDRIEGAGLQEAADLSALVAKVTEATGVDESTLALVEGIAAELDLRPGLEALAATLRSKKEELKAAVVAANS